MIPKLVSHPEVIFKVLPKGIHDSTLHEVKQVYSTNPIRTRLYEGFVEGAKALASAGCKNLYLNGSYVSSKLNPGDFDACWDPVGVDIRFLDQIFLDLRYGTHIQKEHFQGEFFPSTVVESGSNLRFIDFFQTINSSKLRKGIIRIDTQNDPLLRSSYQ